MARIPTGKGRSRTKTLRATYEVLNYSPVDFVFSSKWIGYLQTLGSRISSVLKRTSPDHLNSDMFNPNSKSHAETEKTIAGIQHANHYHLIDHLGRMVEGEKAKAAYLKKNLLSDIALIDRMIEETNPVNVKDGSTYIMWLSMSMIST